MSYRSSLSAVLADVVAPAAEVTGERGRFPRAAVTALGRAGLLGLTAPTADGGGGRGCAEAAEVVARTARVCPATAAVLTSHFAAVAALGVYGNPWLRGEIAAGRHLATLALGDIGPEGLLAEEGTGRRHLSPGEAARPPSAPVVSSPCGPGGAQWSPQVRRTVISGRPRHGRHLGRPCRRPCRGVPGGRTGAA